MTKVISIINKIKTYKLVASIGFNFKTKEMYGDTKEELQQALWNNLSNEDIKCLQQIHVYKWHKQNKRYYSCYTHRNSLYYFK